MADLDLDAIRARAAAATPGSWYVLGPPWARDVAEVQAGDPDPHKATPIADFDLAWHPHFADEDPPNRFNDAEFAAHARADVPALLAEVSPLRQFEAAVRVLITARRLGHATDLEVRVGVSLMLDTLDAARAGGDARG